MNRPAAPPRVLLASTNPAKIDRLRACLAGHAFQFSEIDDLPRSAAPPESGETHRLIAESKALAWARIGGCLAIASDGGMDIPALGPRWNSLFTRRAAGTDVTDQDRITHLLTLMDRVAAPADRAATWREALTVAHPDGIVRTWETAGPTGLIRREPSQMRIEGFWLASLWHFERFNKAYTELSEDELEQIGDPWRRLAANVQAWLSAGGYTQLTATVR